MGNLRQSMTDEEWYADLTKIKKDKESGKPDSDILRLPLYHFELDDLIKIRHLLSAHFNDFTLSELDKHIAWKTINK